MISTNATDRHKYEETKVGFFPREEKIVEKMYFKLEQREENKIIEAVIDPEVWKEELSKVWKDLD